VCKPSGTLYGSSSCDNIKNIKKSSKLPPLFRFPPCPRQFSIKNCGFETTEITCHQRRTHNSNSDPPCVSPKPDTNPTGTYNSRRSIQQYNISPVYQNCEETCINLQRVAVTAPLLGFTTIQFTKSSCSAHRPVLGRSPNPHLTHT
jgi:hypothetical protein